MSVRESRPYKSGLSMGKTFSSIHASNSLHVQQNLVNHNAQIIPMAPYWRACEGYSVLNGVPHTRRHDGWWHPMRSHH